MESNTLPISSVINSRQLLGTAASSNRVGMDSTVSVIRISAVGRTAMYSREGRVVLGIAVRKGANEEAVIGNDWLVNVSERVA